MSLAQATYWAVQWAALATGAEPSLAGRAFVRHDLNPDSTFPACAVFDVNHDGKLDVLSGGWWYEAPTWKKRFVRDVEEIRGRFDDYSNLEMDVNGDGWTDTIACNYRSQKIYWVEHPGALLGPWKVHTVDMPGPSETGRLMDVDGDGRPDILPNGAKFAAWWELLPAKSPGDVKWQKHELPLELAGHGIGLGDINGDGRNDLVCPHGWLEAPEDRRAGRWKFHADFKLHRDGSIPMLVFDIDGDGDNDICYGRGHGIGMYWAEQVRDAKAKDKAGASKWALHAIDTSWTQAHTIMPAPGEKPGQIDVIAGKRYMGHDGKDLGEYDPLSIHRYRYDPSRRTWDRSLISYGGNVALGLDPKLIDLDADGDLDLVTGDRSGLFWLENVPALPKSGPQPAPPFYPNHAQLLVYRDGEQLKPVTDRTAWGLRRSHILENMQTVMGALPGPERRVPVDMKVEGEEDAGKYVRQRISFASEPGDRVPAYLLVPKGLTKLAPAMLCLHQTTKIGKGQPAGLDNSTNLHYAHELAERGYVCIVPDYPSFGDYAYDFKANAQYASGTMKAIWNNHRAVDVLESLPEVDREKIGVIGHSLGGHNALFTAAFDQRLKAVVTSCGFNGFEDYAKGNLKGWTSDRYMPRIASQYGNDGSKMPFDFHEVLAAIAPRGIFVNAPEEDDNFPVIGVRKVQASVNEVYALLESPDRFVVQYPAAKHDFPRATREAAYEWLGKVLK